jgi:hypothetical protein
MDGLWMQDKSRISFNHCSGAQLLNLACNQYECDEVLLVGHDFHYNGQRHYFKDLSGDPGEYPKQLRKYSTFDGLIETYRHIGEQTNRPRIVNCTDGSALPWFPTAKLEDYCENQDCHEIRSRVGMA